MMIITVLTLHCNLKYRNHPKKLSEWFLKNNLFVQQAQNQNIFWDQCQCREDPTPDYINCNPVVKVYENAFVFCTLVSFKSYCIVAIQSFHI